MFPSVFFLLPPSPLLVPFDQKATGYILFVLLGVPECFTGTVPDVHTHMTQEDPNTQNFLFLPKNSFSGVAQGKTKYKFTLREGEEEVRSEEERENSPDSRLLAEEGRMLRRSTVWRLLGVTCVPKIQTNLTHFFGLISFSF